MFKFKRAFEQKNRCDVRFEQAYRHVRQFVSKSGLHKVAFFFFVLSLARWMSCASFTLTSRRRRSPNVN